MEIVLRKGAYKKGDLVVVVKFSEASNFDVKKLEWVPKLEELELIQSTRRKVIDEK